MLALGGSASLVVRPWRREPLVGSLLSAVRGWKSCEVEAAGHVAATWPLPGTSLQAREEVALRPEFALDRWAPLFFDRSAREVGPGRFGNTRAMELARSLRCQPEPVATQGIRIV